MLSGGETGADPLAAGARSPMCHRPECRNRLATQFPTPRRGNIERSGVAGCEECAG